MGPHRSLYRSQHGPSSRPASQIGPERCKLFPLPVLSSCFPLLSRWRLKLSSMTVRQGSSSYGNNPRFYKLRKSRTGSLWNVVLGWCLNCSSLWKCVVCGAGASPSLLSKILPLFLLLLFFFFYFNFFGGTVFETGSHSV